MTETRPLRALAEVALGKMRTPESDAGTNLVPYLRAANVGDGRLRLDDVKTMHFSPREFERHRLQPGDVLVTEASGSRNQVGQTALYSDEVPGAAMQNTLLRLRPYAGTDARYLYWWSRFAFGSGLYAEAAQGLGIWHLGADRLRRLPVPSLPMSEQRRIADFLDEQVPLLDRGILLRKQQTDLLDQRTRSLLSVQTSGGEMGESTGDRWYPRLPQDWIVLPLKYLTQKIGSGKTPSGGAAGYQDSGVALLRSQNIHNDGLRLSDVAFISHETDEEMAGTRVKPGDVLYNITGASLGRCTVAPPDLPPANVNQHVCIIRCADPRDALYVSRALISAAVMEQVRASQVGGNRDGLNFDQLGNLRLAVPRSPAQRQTVALSLEDSLAAQADLRGLYDRQVVLIRERKQVLIATAVTGQLNVTTTRSVA